MKTGFRWVFAFLAAGVSALFAAMLWQHTRYDKMRRETVQDRQPTFYTGTFHVVLFLKVPPDEDMIASVRRFRTETSSPDARWVYAGKAAANAMHSSRIGPIEWSAVVLLQYRSPEAYIAHASSSAFRSALERFSAHYTQGFQRPALINLAIPQGLLALKARQALLRQSSFPLTPAEDTPEALQKQLRTLQRQLFRSPELGQEAVVIVNLIQRGDAAQRAADAAYAGKMMEMMAERGYGPLHFGAAVTVANGVDFDQVAFVYYPSVNFFAELINSTAFQTIIGNKQLADTQATITIPILNQL